MANTLNVFYEKVRLLFGDRILRGRVLFVLFALVLFRVGASIPIPGVDTARLESLFSGSQFFGLLNIFSGGGLKNISIVMLGVGPYITASIIMQLLTIIFPRIKELYHEAGEAGRRKFTQYSRLATIPLAAIQGFGLLTILTKSGVITDLSLFQTVTNIFVVSAGSILLMWLGELITEFGIGNGVSMIIFAGIIAGMPSAVARVFVTFTAADLPVYLAFLVFALLVIAGVVFITEAERPIPVTYAKRVRGMKMYGGVSTYLPLRVNQAGVIPIIFALSILLFPQMILSFFVNSANATVASVAHGALSVISNPWLHASFYFILVFLFTYFYTAVTFDPDAISENLQKSGAFIPGTRPGKPTSLHIGRILTRLTFVGALFLGLIAVLPLIMQSLTGIQALAIGGTGLLIVVSVVIDLLKKIEAQLTMREY
jgi:preprotein translocase subunit SecY